MFHVQGVRTTNLGTVGQEPAVLAAGMVWIFVFRFYINSKLFHLSFRMARYYSNIASTPHSYVYYGHNKRKNIFMYGYSMYVIKLIKLIMSFRCTEYEILHKFGKSV